MCGVRQLALSLCSTSQARKVYGRSILVLGVAAYWLIAVDSGFAGWAAGYGAWVTVEAHVEQEIGWHAEAHFFVMQRFYRSAVDFAG